MTELPVVPKPGYPPECDYLGCKLVQQLFTAPIMRMTSSNTSRGPTPQTVDQSIALSHIVARPGYRMVGARARGIKCPPPKKKTKKHTTKNKQQPRMAPQVKDMKFSWIPMFNMILGTVHTSSTTTKRRRREDINIRFNT